MLPLPLYGIMHWTEVIRIIQKARAECVNDFETPSWFI
jgi:hypothetical protein